MFYGWHLGKAHLEQILKDGIMMAGLGVVTGIKRSHTWKCKQGLWAWKAEAAMPQQLSSERCLLVMPRKCHGVDKRGMQSLTDSKQQEIPSGSLQRGLQALLIIQQPREASPWSDCGGTDSGTEFPDDMQTYTDWRYSVIILCTLEQKERELERQKQHETLNKTHKWDWHRGLSHTG